MKKLFNKRFLKIMVVGIATGIVLKVFLNKEILENVGDAVRKSYLASSFYLIMASMILSLITSYIFYRKSLALVEDGLKGDGLIETKYTNFSLRTRDLGIFITFVLFSGLILSINLEGGVNDGNILRLIVGVLTFGIFIYLSSVILDKNYLLIQKIEPNRKADSLDLNFNEKFIEESDERVRAEYYKKGYKGYQRMPLANFIMLAIICLFSFELDLGILSPILLGISSLVGIVAAK